MLTKTMIKGSPEYALTDESGRVVATSHCVNVPSNLFTVVVNGQWKGVLPEAKAVEYLRGLV